MAKMIAVRTSLRRRSNSNILLDAAAEAAREAGASVDVVDIGTKAIGPCKACDACKRDGRCVWKGDDFCELLDRMWEAGRVLIATPVYYMAAPAQLKLFIDRTQCLYNRKYVLKDVLPADALARRRGGVIAVCGSRFKRAFEGIDLTMRFFFDSLQMDWTEKLYVQHVDRPGEIEDHPRFIEQAREMGRRLATAEEAAPPP